MTRSLLPSALAVALLPFAPGFPADPPAAPKSPLFPADERATFKLPPGLRIDLIASEPQIESPVACAFDERGRLWVVEMRDYPNGPAPGQPPGSRIKVLEDRDGDGHYETATVFADHLLFANGVLPWAGGAIVTAAPHILYLKDTDGDGKADLREVLYEGFTAGNPQLRVSHPALGPDGWVYVANGLRGGEIRRAGKPNAPAIPLGGKDFRFDVVRDRAEAIPGMGQFGNAFDRWGQRFVCDNRHHLRHVVFPTDPSTRNPNLVAPLLLHDTAGDPAGGAKVYPLGKNWTTSNLHAGQFTAACGVFIDQGGLLPPPFAGAAFTCEPTADLVHCETLEPDGATFRSRPWKEGTEFLASPDLWCRPVSMAQAPDGSLVVVDMYRAVIEHPEFMPPELKNRPDLLLGRERGRIWRVAPEGSKPAAMRPGLDKLAPGELVKVLEHANGWHRTTAQRLLLTSTDRAVVPALNRYLLSRPAEDGLILAAWLLEAKQNLPRAYLVRMMGNIDPRVREHAARLLEREPKATFSEYRLLAMHPDTRVRFQTALALGACNDDFILPLLAEIAERDAADRWTRIAVASSSAGRTGKLVRALLADRPDFATAPTADRLNLIRELCELVGSGRDPAEAGAVIDALAQLDAKWQRAALSGLADGVARRGTPFPQFAEKLPGGAKPALALLESATRPAADPKASDAERAAAVRLLAHAPWESAGGTLTALLKSDDTPLSLRPAVVRALAAHPRPEVAGLLLANWRGYTPAVRSEVLESLLRRPEWSAALLDAVESGRVKPGDIDPTRARRLMGVKDKPLAARATKLLKDSLPADRKEVLAAYRPALALPADTTRGREVFKKNCAACHVIAGIGVQVGPDISDTRTKTAEQLLTDILSPNAAIDGNYIAYTVRTTDGKVVTGLIAAESAGGITLKRENNQTETVLRADIEEVRSSGLSLMPDGLEKNMTVQEVADLIRFLKDWRYLDGSVPTGK